MTTNKTPLHGLPCISRPQSTLIERMGFYMQRNWKWTTVLGCIAGTAFLLGTVCAIEVWQGEHLTQKKVLGVLLMLLPLNYIPLFVVPLIEQKVAPPWMIRSALACATDDERAFLIARLQQVAVSHWREGPLDRGDLFRLFRQARCNFGVYIKSERERMVELRAMQVEEINALGEKNRHAS